VYSAKIVTLLRLTAKLTKRGEKTKELRWYMPDKKNRGLFDFGFCHSAILLSGF